MTNVHKYPNVIEQHVLLIAHQEMPVVPGMYTSLKAFQKNAFQIFLKRKTSLLAVRHHKTQAWPCKNNFKWKKTQLILLNIDLPMTTARFLHQISGQVSLVLQLEQNNLWIYYISRTLMHIFLQEAGDFAYNCFPPHPCQFPEKMPNINQEPIQVIDKWLHNKQISQYQEK